jgi:hypothetical protein
MNSRIAADDLAFCLEFVTNRSPNDELRKLLHGTDSRIKQRLNPDAGELDAGEIHPQPPHIPIRFCLRHPVLHGSSQIK